MQATHNAPVLFRNTMQITGGHLASFKHAVQRAVKFVEQRLLAYSFQLYRDSESILIHWKMSDPHIREVMGALHGATI